MIQQLHVHVHLEPARRRDEEPVVVGGDVEGAEVVHEGWSDLGGPEGVEVDDYGGLLV